MIYLVLSIIIINSKRTLMKKLLILISFNTIIIVKENKLLGKAKNKISKKEKKKIFLHHFDL